MKKLIIITFLLANCSSAYCQTEKDIEESAKEISSIMDKINKKGKKIHDNPNPFGDVQIKDSETQIDMSNSRQVTLPAGTNIPIQLNQNLKSDFYYNGVVNTVAFVSSNIYGPDGTLLITEGTPVSTRVQIIKNRPRGRGGKITITPISTKLFNGQDVTLSGQSLYNKGRNKKGLISSMAVLTFWMFPYDLFFMCIKGRPAKIMQGSSWNARITSDVITYVQK